MAWLPIVLDLSDPQPILLSAVGSLVTARLGQEDDESGRLLAPRSNILYCQTLSAIQSNLSRATHVWNVQTLAALQVLRYYEVVAATSQKSVAFHLFGVIAYLEYGQRQGLLDPRRMPVSSWHIVQSILKDTLYGLFDLAEVPVLCKLSPHIIASLASILRAVWPHDAADVDQRIIASSLESRAHELQVEQLLDDAAATPPQLALISDKLLAMHTLQSTHMSSWYSSSLPATERPYFTIHYALHCLVTHAHARRLAALAPPASDTIARLASAAHAHALWSHITDSLAAMRLAASALGLLRSHKILWNFTWTAVMCGDAVFADDRLQPLRTLEHAGIHIAPRYDRAYWGRCRAVLASHRAGALHSIRAVLDALSAPAEPVDAL